MFWVPIPIQFNQNDLLTTTLNYHDCQSVNFDQSIAILKATMKRQLHNLNPNGPIC